MLDPMRSAIALVLGAALAIAGCGASMRDRARVRHSAETGCAVHRVNAREINRSTWQAWGCDTSAVYICNRAGVCSLDGRVRQTGARRAAAPVAARSTTTPARSSASSTTGRSESRTGSPEALQDPWR